MIKTLTDSDKKMTAWVGKWKKFIIRFAKLIDLTQTDKDDWFQAAYLTYWKYAKKYDPSLERSFDSYILQMVKFNLLNLKQKQTNKNRLWLKNSVTLCESNLEKRTTLHMMSSFGLSNEARGESQLEMNISKNSETILSLILAGYRTRELVVRLGIPTALINQAKDEAVCHFIKGGNMKLRNYIEERATELGVEYSDSMDDIELANAILVAGSSVRRTFRIVSPATTTEGDEAAKVCKADACENSTAEGSGFCSLKCAERTFTNFKRGQRAKRKPPSHVRSTAELADIPFSGEISQEAVDLMNNPFHKKHAAYWAFELFRIGGTRHELAERLDATLQSKGIKCTSPMERVRRVITDIRRLGFELPKSSAGVFRLTGRRK